MSPPPPRPAGFQTGFETERTCAKYRVKVARYHLVTPASYLFLLWILPFSFAIGAVTACAAAAMTQPDT